MAFNRNRARSNERNESGVWTNAGSDFVLLHDIQPPPRIELARQRMLLCRLYIGLIRTINDDYGNNFARHSDSATFRTIGIYVFLRTLMCSPVRAITIAQSLKIPRAATGGFIGSITLERYSAFEDYSSADARSYDCNRTCSVLKDRCRMSCQSDGMHSL